MSPMAIVLGAVAFVGFEIIFGYCMARLDLDI